MGIVAHIVEISLIKHENLAIAPTQLVAIHVDEAGVGVGRGETEVVTQGYSDRVGVPGQLSPLGQIGEHRSMHGRHLMQYRDRPGTQALPRIQVASV
nr:hypothetical protein [Phyllobacterium bourgognense]